MAIEAQQINLLPYQLLSDNRDYINTKNRILTNLYDTQMESALLPLATTVPETTLVPFYQSSVCDLGHATKASLKSDSGLTYNNVNNIPVPRKRTRDTFDELNNAFINVVPQKHPKMSSFMDQDLALFQIQQQQQQNSEITSIIEEHTRKMKLDIEEMVKQQSKLLLSLASREIMSKLKQKEQEIERLVKLNWMLQDRVRTLCMENQIWRGLAQTNEATANSLRTNLEQVLAHVSEDRAAPCDAGPAAADNDAESCCGSSDYGRECIDTEVVNNNKIMVAADDQHGTQPQPPRSGGGCGYNDVRMCKSCGAKESSVLVLPCRHLSLCTGCGSSLHNCPVCSTVVTGSVHVNLS